MLFILLKRKTYDTLTKCYINFMEINHVILPKIWILKNLYPKKMFTLIINKNLNSSGLSKLYN